MKQRVTLALLAVLFVAASSFAQGKKMLQMQQSQDKQQVMHTVVASHAKKTGKILNKKHQRAAVRRSAADIIDVQPEGTLVNYVRSGDAYVPTMFGSVYHTEVSGAVGAVVFAADNKVYFKDIVSQTKSGTWIVGTLNGNTITIELPQTVWDSGEDYCVEVAKMSFDEEDETYVRAANQTVVLNYHAETGAITTPKGRLTSGNDIIGLSYDDDMTWAGSGDWNITFEKITDELVEAPEGLTTEPYSLTADSYTGSLVNVGFSGNDVYVQGIDVNLPNTWVKGTLSGNKVTFKSGQYVGADEVAGCHQYLMAANAETKYDSFLEEYYTEYSLSDDDITFDYDPATKTFSNSNAFVLNAGMSDINYLSAFDKATMAPFTEVAATPAAPEVELYETGYDYYTGGYGWGSIYFDLKTADVDGNYIMPEKTSYKLWVRVNGEEKPLSLSWYDYINQKEETMDEIPHNYQDDWDIGNTDGQKYIYYYVVGPEAYGIQAIYRGAGEERVSEISWAEVEEIGADIQPDAATPAYPDATISETDNKIDFGYYTGDENVMATTNNFKPETYDVAVKFDDPALVGTLIESITFPLQSVEGVSDISVFLTSQLRVENGKNAADLVVKAVTPEEAGFVTVVLDKPYTIPEGGVYVGYSMTINDVSFEENALPVTIINKYNDGGYYLHTSDGILKWLDFGELANASAMVQIKVAGSNIKGNAATFVDSTKQYIKKGEPFTIPVTLVNQGSNGIKSIDVKYTVAGQSDTQHIDIEVGGFLGKQATAKLTIPAISEDGDYVLTLSLDKVNGVNNELVAETTMPIVVMSIVPKHRALLEEYTGTWCGWCPRGYVGLEKLAELYPDDYVLVSYHNSDDMEILDEYSFPSNVEGFPDAWIDRTINVDAFYGVNYDVKELGIADDMEVRSQQFGQADINVSATLSEDGESIDVNTSVTFPYNLTEDLYALEYILTADGLTNEKWGQSNNYAGGDEGGYLQEFNDAATTVYGLVYNDVAVMMSEIGGIEESLPATINANEAVSHSYTFELANAVNTQGNEIIQDKSKMKVVALLINTQTGEVVNANKTKVKAPVGITSLNSEKTRVITFHDLMGRRVMTPRNGVYIKTVTTADGKTRNRVTVVGK